MKGKSFIIVITVFITVLLLVYAYFGMDYMNNRNEHKTLNSQIAQFTKTSREMPTPPQNLEQRLAAVQASLAAEQSEFPSKTNSTEVTSMILELADACEVKAIPLVTQPWSIEHVGENHYDVFRLTVTVEGSFSQLVTFVSELENGAYETLIVENLSVTRVTKQSEEESVPEGTIPITASLGLAIYTQSTTSD